jgi:hypothetical protein
MWIAYVILIINFEPMTWESPVQFYTKQECMAEAAKRVEGIERDIKSFGMNQDKPYYLNAVCMQDKNTIEH